MEGRLHKRNIKRPVHHIDNAGMAINQWNTPYDQLAIDVDRRLRCVCKRKCKCNLKKSGVLWKEMPCVLENINNIECYLRRQDRT